MLNTLERSNCDCDHTGNMRQVSSGIFEFVRAGFMSIYRQSMSDIGSCYAEGKMLNGTSVISIKTSRGGTMVHGGLCKLCLGH